MRARPLSIRARLSLWYGASVLAALVVFAVVLRNTVRTTLRTEFVGSITSSADAVRSFFRLEYSDYKSVLPTLAHLSTEVVFPDRLVEFVQPDGKVVFRSGPGLRGTTAGVSDSLSLTGATVQRLSFPLDSALAAGWTVRVSASAASLERSLARIDRWLLIGMPLGCLMATAAGWWLAGRTLRPVGTMAGAAIRMANLPPAVSAAAAVPARLPVDNPTDELGRLGTLFNALLDQRDGALTQQRRFLADAAHELRTPVARMLGTVDLAMLDANDAAAQSEALQRIRGDLTRSTRLVEELLQLARADAAGTVTLASGFVDDVVTDAVRGWQPLAAQNGVTLTVSTLDEAPARFDAVYLERLVSILLDNAIRYTPRGGSVDVRVRFDGAACFEIVDTGIGIPPDERTKVFDRFFRSAQARSMSPDGSGLGLPIAAWIAAAHSARIEFLPGDRDVGTMARVTFPAPAAMR